MNTRYTEVAVALPVAGTFHYLVPPELQDLAVVGRQVVVPFGRRRLTGYIVAVGEEQPAGLETPIRDILEVSTGEPSFSEVHLPLYRWLSTYYLAPLGEVIQSALPQGTTSTTRRGAVVSAAGRRALEQTEISVEDAAVLSLLMEQPGLNLPQIRRRLPDYDGIGRVCRRLGHKALIVWEDRVQKPRVKPRRLKVVTAVGSLVSMPTEGLLKPKEREILALVAGEPRLLRDLEHQVGNGSYWVRKLAGRGMVEVSAKEIYRDPTGPAVIEPGPPLSPTGPQEEAIREISRALRGRRYASFLLHGVTGSGKTEVYLAAARTALELGRQSLVLVPEIALTAQVEALFRYRFHSKVAILHSGLGQGERLDEWLRVRRGEVDVVVGARSALFAPLERLGLIVVDEEHDSSYKQERGLRYHGRDAAVMRARLEGAVVLMGSATPAISSYNNALRGKFRLLSLPHRIDQRPLPRVSIVDMRGQSRGVSISFPLRQALADTLAAGRQALLLINRRGYAGFLLCRRCGHVLRCLNCAVSLTWHRQAESLRCHLCGLALPVPSTCPHCEAATLKPFGFGTQQVEAQVRRLFPEARVDRMDRDTTRGRQAYRRLLGDLGRGRTDILVGTQMIAKGHDFPNITLVGVVSADISLQWPDFRAAEMTFQLLTQVAGRAGRGDDPGRVLVQTYNPEHYSIRFAREHDYVGFYKEEIGFLKELGYPPFRRLVLFQLAGNVEEKTEEAARRLSGRYEILCKERSDLRSELELLGPVAAPLPRVKGKYRWHLLLKGRRSSVLRDVGRQLMDWWHRALKGSGVSLSVDVDPISLI